MQNPLSPLAALDKVERRELASFMRDQRAEQRVRDRGDDDGLPALREVSERQEGDEAQSPDVLRTFVRAKTRQHEDVPDLLGAFRRATSDDATPEQGDGSDKGLEKANAPTPDGKPRGDGTDPGRGRD